MTAPNNLSTRLLAAIMVTDAVGYSTMAGLNESTALSSVERDFGIMREQIEKSSGRVVKSTGDGLLVVFQSASSAITCAMAIQKCLAEKSRFQPEATVLKHRIGIHVGDVVITDDDAMGNGVNVAARLQEEAREGGICISQTVFDVVKQQLTVKPISLGNRQLKNLPEPMPVYELRFDGSPVSAVSSKRKTLNASMWQGASIMGLGVLLSIGIWSLLQLRSPSEKSQRANVVKSQADSVIPVSRPENKQNSQQQQIAPIEIEKPVSKPLVANLPRRQDPIENEAIESSTQPEIRSPVESEKLQKELFEKRALAIQSKEFGSYCDWLRDNAPVNNNPKNQIEFVQFRKAQIAWDWFAERIAQFSPDRPFSFPDSYVGRSPMNHIFVQDDLFTVTRYDETKSFTKLDLPPQVVMQAMLAMIRMDNGPRSNSRPVAKFDAVIAFGSLYGFSPPPMQSRIQNRGLAPTGTHSRD